MDLINVQKLLLAILLGFRVFLRLLSHQLSQGLLVLYEILLLSRHEFVVLLYIWPFWSPYHRH